MLSHLIIIIESNIYLKIDLKNRTSLVGADIKEFNCFVIIKLIRVETHEELIWPPH